MNDGMVQLNKVTKAYGSFQLDCSMEVQPGMATGFEKGRNPDVDRTKRSGKNDDISDSAGAGAAGDG